MLTLRTSLRFKSLCLEIPPHCHKLAACLCSKSKKESTLEETKDEPKLKKNTEAINKLNLLLKSMTEEKHTTLPTAVGSQLAKPATKPKKEKVKSEESIITAAKEVAVELGGDVKQTESELLNKLLSSSEAGNSGREETQNLRDLLSGMKIDRSKKPHQIPEEGRAQRVHKILEAQKRDIVREQSSTFRDLLREQQQGSKIHGARVDIFGGELLGIFKGQGEKEENLETDVPELHTWHRLEAQELRLAVTHPPSNIFEELIQWTDEGKLWHFPIDNEQGLEEEKQVYFAEHVFLERHLEPWCPRKGPLRHFMELVCVGLSKNPYLTVQMKVEHINWFHEYFEQKKTTLLETGAIPTSSESESTAESRSQL